ncbi:MAG: agmatinase [Pseudomonadota bacterium]
MSDEPTPEKATQGDLHGIGLENWFSGATSLFRRRYAPDGKGADIAILGVPFDQAVTNRPGARFGPRAIRAASTNLAWPGGPWRFSTDPFAERAVVDVGDLHYDTGAPATFTQTLQTRASSLMADGARLFALGGDHFITGPILRAHASRSGPLALIQFDSHSDTWREPAPRIDHGTMFFHAAEDGIIDPARSVQVGIRSGNTETHGFTIIDADAVADSHPNTLAEEIKSIVGAGPAYLTFDIDFLDPAYAPGTGTPVCGGPSTNKAERILAGLSGLDIVGGDVVEVAPAYDHAEITALAGATMALAIVELIGSAPSLGPRRGSA